MTDLNTQFLVMTSHWRRYKRLFDERLLSERRIIIVAAVVLLGVIFDKVWVTPSYQRLKSSLNLQEIVLNQQRMVMSQATTEIETFNEQRSKAIVELNDIRRRFSKQEEELLAMQSQMAPARDMRQLLEALLTKHGQLRLLAMKTLPPKEVRTNSSSETVLFQHGLAIEVGGHFHDLLAWLQSAENMPRRLIWKSMEIAHNEKTPLVLKVQVYTLSQDKDALEIAR